jgi:hypothetical protein
MATKQQVMRVAAKHGITVVDDGEKIAVDLPPGFVLVGSGLHFLDLHYNSPPGAWNKPDAWESILDDIREGVEPCTDDDCDCCRAKEQGDE